jgi:predicted metal-dependent phosphoesterase TrpH
MRVDLHTHTFPASTCSRITQVEFLDYCRSATVEAIALTNHGDIGDNIALEQPLAEIGVTLIHGIEISTLFGDFVVLSPDLEFLATLRDVQPLPRRSQLPEVAAIVWVHPAAGGGRSGASYYSGMADEVAPLIDAVEVYNGNWPDRRCVETAQRLVAEYETAATGGSDAHEVGQIGRCSTQFTSPLRSTADVVAALRERAVMPITTVPKGGRLGRLFGR